MLQNVCKEQFALSSYHLERQVSNLVALAFSKLSKEQNEKFVKLDLKGILALDFG